MNQQLEQIWIPSVYTGHTHRIRVWVPQNSDHRRKYPVIYMFDGQNVFMDKESYSGHSWRIVEYMQGLALEKQMIVVGIDNSERRYEEYSPWDNEIRKTNFEDRPYGGEGKAYANFVVNEVKAYVDSHYPTLTEKESTFVMGSSMGGIIATYTAFANPQIFGGVGCFSIASWFAERSYLQYVEQTDIPKDMKIYIYVGGRETSDPNIEDMATWYIKNSEHLRDYLIEKGHDSACMKYVFAPEGEHTERCWAENVPACVTYLATSMG